MIFGFDVTDPKLSCCLAKGWEEFSTGTAFILTVFGTEPDRNLIFSDGLTTSSFTVCFPQGFTGESRVFCSFFS